MELYKLSKFYDGDSDMVEFVEQEQNVIEKDGYEKKDQMRKKHVPQLKPQNVCVTYDIYCCTTPFAHKYNNKLEYL